MRSHDVSVVAQLLATSQGRSTVEVASAPLIERVTEDSDTAVYGRHFD